MKWTEWIYNGAIHAGLPLAVGGSYYGFQGRQPHAHTVQKFSTVSSKHLDGPVRIWFHGASVGEAGLINQLLEWTDELGVTSEKVFVTTQTLSGLDRVDHHRKVLLPADYPALIGPLARRIGADILAVLETEIWPNLYRQHPHDLLLLNARMSDSTRNTYGTITPLIRDSLDHCEKILARSESDRDRFHEIVGDKETLRTAGNLKWTRCLNPPEPNSQFVSETEDRPLVVLGSTREGEEEFLLEVLNERDCRILLAPRHLNRVEAVEETLSDFHLEWVRSSQLSEPADPFDEVDVVLLDEFGRLEAAYGTADLALVGGGWSENGGHNPLEAAQYGVPVIVGPDMSNFRESTDFLRELDILVTAESRNELIEAVRKFLDGTDEDKQSDRLGKLQERIEPIQKHYVDALKASLGPVTGGNQE